MSIWVFKEDEWDWGGDIDWPVPNKVSGKIFCSECMAHVYYNDIYELLLAHTFEPLLNWSQINFGISRKTGNQ